MNRWRLTRGWRTPFLRRATRVDNGERIAASVMALVAFVGGIGTILMAPGPGDAMALGVAEARSSLSEITATGMEQAKLGFDIVRVAFAEKLSGLMVHPRVADAVRDVARRGQYGIDRALKYLNVSILVEDARTMGPIAGRRQAGGETLSGGGVSRYLNNAIDQLLLHGPANEILQRAGIVARALQSELVREATGKIKRSLASIRALNEEIVWNWAGAGGRNKALVHAADELTREAPHLGAQRVDRSAARYAHILRSDDTQASHSNVKKAPNSAILHDALGLTRIELTSRKAIPDDGLDPSPLERVFWPGISGFRLLDQSVEWPRLSLTLDRQESQRALWVEGVEELIFGPRVTVQTAPPTISRGPYARASNGRAWWWLQLQDVTASLGGCDGTAPGGIRLRCGEYVASEAGLDPQPPIGLSAVTPRDAGVATTVCAGSACRSPGGPATQAAHEASEDIYSSLAARLQISAPNQPHILPAPPSGWVDIGYISPAPPRWKQTLALICGASQTATPSSLRAQCGLPSATNSGVWGMSFQAAGLEGAFSTAGWHLNMSTPSGINVLVASALQTPLQDFDIDSSWGVQVSTPWGLQLIGTSSGIQVLQYIDLSFGRLFAGITPQGPISGLQFEGDTVNGNISALMSAGQVQAIGDVTVRAGDFDFTSTLTTSDLQLGVSYTFRNGPTVQVSWSNDDGFSAAYMIPNGPTIQLSWSSDSSFTIALTSPLGSGNWPTTIAPLGGGALGFTPPSAFSTIAPSMHLRWPLPAIAQPPPPTAAGLPPASATVVIRFCLDSNGDGVCRQAESHPPVRALVDGQPATTTDGRISVSPGHHTISVPVELIPSRLVPLGDLTCDLTIPASTVGFCDLPVHRAGTP